MSFAKYILIAKNTLQEYFVYRVNFFFWRLQVFITFVMFFSLWSAISIGKNNLGIYSIPQIYSYFVIGYVIRAIVFATRTQDIGAEIQNGNISLLLIKPISTLNYYFARDLVDKLFNLFFMFWEFLLILFLFKPALTHPTFANFLLFLASLLISILLFFFYSLVISFITFWSDSAWSSRFLFGVVFVTLFSGQYIPLDFLPSVFSRFLDYTPFPYMYYYPVKIWLGQIPSSQIYWHLFNGLLISIFFYFLSQFLWLKGKQKYQSYGN
ncbi:MAG: ABC-2 family transporter protein [Microgenomates group bacterium]